MAKSRAAVYMQLEPKRQILENIPVFDLLVHLSGISIYYRKPGK